MNIGCINFCPINGKEFVGIKCKKGRGIILPGGKYEEGETFEETAARELQEETGLLAVGQPKLIFQGFNTDGFYVYSFLTNIVWEKFYEDLETDEGIVVKATWNMIFNSDFKAYYSLLHQVLSCITFF